MTQANETYISLETAKLLKDCGVESKLHYIHVLPNSWEVHNLDWDEDPTYDDFGDNEYYPAFSWQEILWEYPQKFFGEKSHYQVVVNYLTEFGYDYIACELLVFLQQKKYEEADEYFKNHTILIKK